MLRSICLCFALMLVSGIPVGAEESDTSAETSEAARDSTSATLKDIPRSTLLDNSVANLSSTDGGGREDFWRLFGFLIAPESTAEDGTGGFKFETSPVRFLKVSATLGQPELSDAAKQALDEDQEDDAENGLQPFDDILYELKLNFSPGKRGEAATVLSRYVFDYMNDPEFQRAIKEEMDQAVELQGKTSEGRAYMDAVHAMGELTGARQAALKRKEALEKAEELVGGIQSANSDAQRLAQAFETIKAEIEKQSTIIREQPEEAQFAQFDIEKLRGARRVLEEYLATQDPLGNLSERVGTAEAEAARADAEWDKARTAKDEAWDTFVSAHEEKLRAGRAAADLQDDLRRMYAAYRNRLTGHINLRHRQVEDLIGQNETGAMINLTWGYPRIPKKVEKQGALLAKWAKDNADALDRAPHSFSIQAGYTEKREFVSDEFMGLMQLGFEELTASFNWTSKLARKKLKVGNLPGGFDHSLTIRYDRPNEDFANERVTANETLVFHINDSMSLPLSFTWANRDELIDEDILRGQFGFSYTLPNPKELRP